MAIAQKITRAQLEAFFKQDHRLVIAFENLLMQVGGVIPDEILELLVQAGSADAKANQALGALDRIASALELLALAPPQVQSQLIDTGSGLELPSENLLLPVVPEYIDEACYGAFYADNISQNIVVAAAGTAYEITASMTGGITRLASFAGAHYIQVERGGPFDIKWSLSIDTANPLDEIEGGIMINGVARPEGTAHATVPAAGNASTVSGVALLNLAATDQVSLFVKNQTAVRDIIVEHASLTVNLIRRLS